MAFQKVGSFQMSQANFFISQGVIQGVFEIVNQIWASKNPHPNFDKLPKNKIFDEL